MRSFLYLWVLPMSLFGTWYGLSYNDMHGGMWFFSRAMHDQVMLVYATPLGLDPADLPPLLLRALIVDTMLVAAIMAYRYRKRWWPRFSAFIRSHRAPEVRAEHREQTAG